MYPPQMDPYSTINSRKVPMGTYPRNTLDMVPTMAERPKRKPTNRWVVTSYRDHPEMTGRTYAKLRDIPLPRINNQYYASNSGNPPRPRF